MRTTLAIDDDVLAAAKHLAALRPNRLKLLLRVPRFALG